MKKRPLTKTFYFNVGLMIAICIGLYMLFFASLGWLTGHGKELIVPDLIGLGAGEAVASLEKQGYDIDIDSMFDPTQQPLVVLEQQPDKGSTVKQGRTIFLILNKVSSPTIKMPNLVNLSYRSAEMMLKSNKLMLGDTVMKPDLAEGAVLAQLFQGKEIASGTSIAQGSRIDLVIGDGLGKTEMKVPDLIGMNYLEAVALLNASNLNYTVLFDGVISDTLTAKVHMQQPPPYDEFQEPLQISEGDVVDFRVRQNAPEVIADY